MSVTINTIDECTLINAISSIDAMQRYIKKGGDINARSDNLMKVPLFMRAIERKKWDVIYYLVDQGVDLNAQDELGCGPLFLLRNIKEERDLFIHLVSNGADMHLRDFNENTIMEINDHRMAHFYHQCLALQTSIQSINQNSSKRNNRISL